MRYAASFKLPEYRDRPIRIDWLWILHKNKQTATCELLTHPDGGEVRLEADRLVRSETGRDALALMEKGMAWRQPFIEEGWTPDDSFTIPPYDGEPRRLMVLYTLRSPNSHSMATCEVWTHDFGGQVRLEVTLWTSAQARVKSKVLRMHESTDPGVLMAYAEKWRQEHAKSGWTEQ